jgi:hypothetical protein
MRGEQMNPRRAWTIALLIERPPAGNFATPPKGVSKGVHN